MQIKQINNFPNYMCYSDGRVFSKKRKKFLKPFKTSKDKGYLAYKLSNGKEIKTFQAHRLVGITFIDNPLNKPEINHINGVKTDNRLENLEWVTHSENILHAIKNNLLVHKNSENHCRSTMSNFEVEDICLKFQNGLKPNDLYKNDKFKQNIIYRIFRRENWIEISKNYTWNIPVIQVKSKGMDIETVRYYCEEFQKGKKPLDFVKSNDKLYDKLRKIYHRVNYIEISCIYNW